VPGAGLLGRERQVLPGERRGTIAAECAHARVITLSHCGHWVMVEHTELFNRMTLDFLARG
jgi:4,5:9,10-diseco-3-hydroxy-5,9,17-trioxoandrosta-1(10),2-diene-4-oate hydrolase